MNNAPSQRGTLSPQRRALLAALLKEQGVAVRHTAIPQQPRDTNVFPMSFAQQRLWFAEQLEPGSPVYNHASAIRLRGALDTAALQRSLQTIIARHEVLRTTFTQLRGNLVQVIDANGTMVLGQHDLSHLPAEEREQEARRLAVADAQRPFDLEHGPLLRAVLLRLDSTEYMLLLTIHHIITDAWSNGVLNRELALLYDAFAQGRPSPLPPLPVQYADVAVWQREQLQGELRESQLSYWKQQLAGAPPLLELPTDYPRPPVQRFRGAYQPLVLSPALGAELSALAQREGVTLFMTLLAAFDTLLFRYTGQSDILVGSPSAGRNRSETEGLIGFFVNMLVLRTSLAGDPTFREVLQRVRATSTGAFAHQDLPFEQLVEELQPERNLGHSPIFQVAFALRNVPHETLQLSRLRIEPVHFDATVTSEFDMTLFMAEEVGGLSGALEYNPDLFDSATISRMVEHFQVLLQSIVADPGQHISRLALLTPAQRQQTLRVWNNPEVVSAADQCFDQLFAAQVARAPEAVALVADDQQLSYGTLYERACQLAHQLQQHQIGADMRVGLCVERSADMVVGMLGILLAGAAYVPLDPAYPSERLQFMLEDAQTAVLLTQQSLLERILPQHMPVISLDRDWEQISQQPSTPPVTQLLPDNLAYVIYTSGSTGQPKGVMIQQRSLCHFSTIVTAEYAIGPRDRVLQFTSLSWDTSIEELFPCLVHGATLVLRPAHMLDSMATFVDICRELRITVLNLPTAVWHTLAAALGDEQLVFPETIRLVIIGGERVRPEHAATWLRQTPPQLRLLNTYGLAETTVEVTRAPLERMPDDAPGEVPIGRPFPTVQSYVLDAWLEPTPVGVAGEVYVGGPGLARGYLARPALTGERFIPHPWSVTPGARLYKTGDLARFLPDGTLEFLERTDHQVKIRGFRIELGEVEAALCQHSAVREVVTMARQDVPGDTRLVAYVIPHSGQQPSSAELRGFMQTKLPGYMVPSAFVLLDTLPLTANGKLDYQQLPAPTRGPVTATMQIAAPSTPVEELLAGIWTQLLNIEQISLDDNFFDLGGHSLLATQLASRIRETFQAELPLRSLFEAPNLRGLAEQVVAAQQASSSQSIPAVRPVEQHEHMPLSFGQQRLWFLDQLQPGSASYTMPAALALHGPLDHAALAHSLTAVVARHAVLRTTFAEVGTDVVQRIHPPAPVPLPLVDLRALPPVARAAEAQQRAHAQAAQPFDLRRGPLLRATLLSLEPQTHHLLLTLHHSVADGWSLDVLLRDLRAAYTAACEGQPLALPPLPVQYADYAVWQRTVLQGELLDGQRRYWRTQLTGAPALLELPTDFPRPPVQSFQGATRALALSPAVSAALETLSRREHATVFMVLLAAFQTLLARYTRQDDIVVGSPIANRNREETEDLIGFFVNTLVLRGDLSGNPSFRELLGRVRETTLQAYAHQDVPFEMLVEELQPARALSHTPLFQVMFVFQATPAPPLDLPGLTLNALPLETGMTKFDLTLNLERTADGFSGWFEYSTDLFAPQTIDRLAEHFQTVVAQVVADPTQRIADIPLLSAAEREQMLEGWNTTDAAYPADVSLHQLIAAQTARTPDAVAVAFQDHALTYRELDQRANQLARALQRQGVGPDVLVGVCMERSLELIVGLLGILKAGGAYVPIDPEYPAERVAFMLADADVPILLTQQRLVAALPTHTARLLCLDSDWPSIGLEDATPPVSHSTSAHLAYMIYTSGSTGKPKGAMNTHGAICNRLLWMQDAYQLSSDDRVLQKTPFSFDVSVWEFFWPLITGARLVFAQPGGHKDGAYLVGLIREQQITTLHFVPSMLRVFLETPDVEACRSLRRVICSGEALPPDLQARFFSRLDTELHNLYGPTEAAVDVTFWPCQRDSQQHSVPIGWPVANTRMYVLDPQLQPVPIRVAGELYIGGVQLARGYHRRPALTAERFIAHPWSATPGERLYRTGDLARYLPNGAIEYLGRIDHQIKLRGFRIELGEIEAVLNQMPGVQDSVVLAREDVPGDQRLVAYVVAEEPRTKNQEPTGEEPGSQFSALGSPDSQLSVLGSGSELRRFVQQSLPAYMVPSAFVVLPHLPLMPNGKLDRRALPAPEQDRSERVVEGPRTPTEAALVEMWADVLRLPEVSIHDNFFTIGGHSLLAAQIIARVRSTMEIELPLRDLFEAPTIARLATTIDTIRQEQTLFAQDVVLLDDATVWEQGEL